MENIPIQVSKLSLFFILEIIQIKTAIADYIIGPWLYVWLKICNILTENEGSWLKISFILKYSQKYSSQNFYFNKYFEFTEEHTRKGILFTNATMSEQSSWQWPKYFNEEKIKERSHIIHIFYWCIKIRHNDTSDDVWWFA